MGVAGLPLWGVSVPDTYRGGYIHGHVYRQVKNQPSRSATNRARGDADADAGGGRAGYGAINVELAKGEPQPRTVGEGE